MVQLVLFTVITLLVETLINRTQGCLKQITSQGLQIHF